MENRCVCCGEIIPEGIHVCYSCMNSFITDIEATEKRFNDDMRKMEENRL